MYVALAVLVVGVGFLLAVVVYDVFIQRAHAILHN